MDALISNSTIIVSMIYLEIKGGLCQLKRYVDKCECENKTKKQMQSIMHYCISTTVTEIASQEE